MVNGKVELNAEIESESVLGLQNIVSSRLCLHLSQVRCARRQEDKKTRPGATRTS